MSSSDERTHLKLLTVGDFDPESDNALEYDFIGRVIARRYTILGSIGGGGMADVYKATDNELGLEVAIKLLKPKMASDELRARMVQEAQAAAQVRHPNLVRVFGTGTLDRTAYIVMELLDGPNLEQYLHEYRDQRIRWREALDLLLPALEALDAVHARGYVHRDIKTGNLLVVREPGRPPTAVVIDLGLVKADPALRNAASPATTEVGRLLCTPGYTSPEQAAGQPVDRRSDVYSMAVTLYRVLAGRLPFHEARGQPVMVVLAKHIYNEPTRLSVAGAGANIPPAIAAVIESALRKQPDQRPQSMLAFADALRAAAASVDEAAQGPARRRALSGPLIGFGLGLAVASIITSLLVDRAAPVIVAEVVDAGVIIGSSATAAETASPTPWSVPLVLDAAPLPEQPHTPPVLDLANGAPFVDSPIAAPPDPGGSQASPPRRTPPTPASPETSARQALARRQADIQRCADDDSGSNQRLPVSLNIDATGRIFAQVVGAPNSTLSRCLNRVLEHARIAAPRDPVSFIHVLKLRPPRR